ncbi:MAG: MFS transporter [Planctomycetes bacterium]|nr:MFS transporter [Planctomycetota bacterium]
MRSRKIPGTVVLLGLASLCMDLSSEMIHSLLPVFLVSVLGAGTVALGLIEGIAEATASIAKIFSGVLSDHLRRRKPLVVLGYGLAAFSKPLFPLATAASWVLAARFIDRTGKGIRGAPRDALVADMTPPEIRGAAYGLRQSLDTVGAFLGPLAAILLMGALANNVRAVFWVAVLPAFLAVALLAWGIEEPARHVDDRAPRTLPHWRDLRLLGAAFWFVVAVGAVFTLARFSEAFLVLRAHQAGLSFAWTPLALVAMNSTYLATAYPAGRLSDRVDRVWLLVLGLAVLIGADLMLAFSHQLGAILVGIALWGVHMGLTQGLLATMVADAAPVPLRGSAFGVFHFVGGCAALLASLLAGALWAASGPVLTFLAGAVFSAAALGGLLWWWICYAEVAAHIPPDESR